MFSKLASSSLSSSYNWMKKIDPTAIPEPTHSRRKDLNVPYPPFSERPAIKRRPSKKPFILPPSAVIVDLSQETSSESKHIRRKKPSVTSSHNPNPNMMLSKSANRRKLRSTPRPHKRSKQDCRPKVIIDLTTPAPLSSIRQQNQVFFSYDPRGVSVNNIPADYCHDCRCPAPYCADIVFGIHCNQAMERLIGRMGFNYHRREKDILWDYHSHYVNTLEMKLSFNNIRVGNFSFDRDAELPMCVKKGSYNTFLNDLKLWRNGESDTEKKTITVVDFVNDDDIDKGLPPLMKRQDTDSDDDEDDDDKVRDDVMEIKDERIINRRTAIEQASDIGAAFKLMKSYVNKEHKVSKVVNPYKK